LRLTAEALVGRPTANINANAWHLLDRIARRSTRVNFMSVTPVDEM
jgi:hypothetical protein